jgi:diguanylate cyclase (GGDEF)-like protein
VLEESRAQTDTPPVRRFRLYKPGLVSRVALVSLIPVVCLGIVLGQYLEHQIRARSMASNRATAIFVASAIQSQLGPSDFTGGLAGTEFLAVDGMLAELKQRGIVRITVWDRRGRVRYSDDRKLVSRAFPLTRQLRTALEGRTSSAISSLHDPDEASEHRYGQLLEVSVPVRFQGYSRPSGAIELHFPYRPIARAIEHDTRTTYLFLVSGLLLLYGALFRIVKTASRKLRLQAEENEYLALHDHLTNLPNRVLFLDRVRQAISARAREPGGVAVMLMDLDRFKEVNDTLGHHYGDELLKELSARLRLLLRESDSVARLGGDEFGFLLARIAGADTAVTVAQRIGHALQRPFLLDGLPIETEASIGIALSPQHGNDVEELLRRADVALYFAKEARTHYALYNFDQDEYQPERLALIGELRRAIATRELFLVYQPQAGLADGRVRCVEALVRWNHPDRGLVTPDEFIPLAQHTSLIGPLTLYVLETAIRQCRAWREQGLDLAVSVNVATRNLLDLQFPAQVGRLLAQASLPAEALQLEITESSVLADPLRAAAILGELSDMGVKLAVDDFGTGYSSLSYLSELPVDQVKIDKSFVLGMPQDEHGSAIVRVTVALARDLSLETVAEGVETPEAWDALRELGCQYAQGFLLSRPQRADELGHWLWERAGSAQPSRHARASLA